MEDMTPQQAINREREYQKKKWGNLDLHNSTGDFIAYMQNYLDKARQANHPLKTEEVMTMIRKVTTLGIAAMEKFGVGEWPMESEENNGLHVR